MNRRRSAPAGAPTIPGTAVTPPRPSLDDTMRATARPVPPVPGQQPLVADGPLIGSLCTGYGGLDMAVQEVLGGSLGWVSDVDPGACRILAHRHPHVPNIGDLTVADWQQIVDTYGRPYAVCGGYPCQPFSLAGLLKGTKDERHLWPHIARALGVLRPRYAIFENVANHLRIGFDVVLADLADLGFDVEWDVVRADEVGAPHQRRRLIVLAVAQDADSAARGQRGIAASREAQGGRARSDVGGRGRAPASDTDGDAVRQQSVAKPGGGGAPVAGRHRAELATDSDIIVAGEYSELPPGRDTVQRGVWADSPRCGTAAADASRGGQQPNEQRVQPGEPDVAWGRFRPAVARWEAVTGRCAPWATDDRGRLNPAFVEWMMGLDVGHVTAVPGLTRNEQLKALGNGVVPQQAAAALRMLLARSRDGQRAA
jgi:DNA (cytosine-5)-methyltransferase 1